MEGKPMFKNKTLLVTGGTGVSRSSSPFEALDSHGSGKR